MKHVYEQIQQQTDKECSFCLFVFLIKKYNKKKGDVEWGGVGGHLKQQDHPKQQQRK